MPPGVLAFLSFGEDHAAPVAIVSLRTAELSTPAALFLVLEVLRSGLLA